MNQVAQDTQIVEIHVPARLDQVGLARLLVAAAASRPPPELDMERLDDLRVVISEACTNAVEAMASVATTGDEEHHITVRCTIEPHQLVVEVIDKGPGIPASVLARERSLDVTHGTGGVGLALMEQLSDACEIQTGPQGTTVRLTFTG